MTASDDDSAPDRPGKLHLTPAAPVGEGEPITGLPFSREIGMRLHQAEDGVAVGSVPYDARLVGDPETGVLHGGVITALLDTACGWAVMASAAALKSPAPLDLRIDYKRPATAGTPGRTVTGEVLAPRSIGFARAVAYNSDPRDPVATAQGAFILDRAADKEA